MDVAPGSRVTAARAVVRSSRRPLSLVERYAIAVGGPLVALGVSLLLEPYMARATFVLFWPAVISSAIYAGLGPALLSSVLCVLAVDYWLIPPIHSLRASDPADLIAFVVFFVAAVAVSSVANRQRAAEQRAAEAAGENAELAGQLEEQAIELESQLEESQAMSEELEQSATELQERTGEAEDAAVFSRSILESISDPFVVQDAEWRFRFINAGAAQVFVGSGVDSSQSLVGRAAGRT